MFKHQNKNKILKSNLLAVKASSFIRQSPAVEFGAGTSPKLVPAAPVWIGQWNLGFPPLRWMLLGSLELAKKKKNKEIIKKKTFREQELASTQMTTLALAAEGSLLSAFIIPGSRRTS